MEIILAILIGVAVALQGPFNGLWAKNIGLAQTILINAIIVLAGAILFLLISHGSFRFSEMKNIDLSIAAGGICGLFIITAGAYVFPRQGASTTLCLLLLGQFLAATIMDHFGLIGLPRQPINFQRIIALILLGVSACLFKIK